MPDATHKSDAPSSKIVSYFTYLVYTMPSYSYAQPAMVNDRDPETHAKDAPENALGFYYYDIAMGATGDPAADAKKHLNISKHYCIDAEILDIAAVRKLPGDFRILIQSMYLEGADSKVIRHRNGTFITYKPQWHEVVSTT
jgi:hypothetical protein